jgi:hypothetical protein
VPAVKPPPAFTPSRRYKERALQLTARRDRLALVLEELRRTGSRERSQAWRAASDLAPTPRRRIA